MAEALGMIETRGFTAMVEAAGRLEGGYRSSGSESGRKRPATIARGPSRTPSSDTSRSSAIGFALGIRRGRKPRRCSLATS